MVEIKVHCSNTRMVPTGELKENPKNPNTHSDDQIGLLSKILSKHGWRAPITVSNKSGFITRGHARLLAAKELALTEVPVDYQDYENDEQELADMLADNRLAELSVRDEDSVEELLKELKNKNYDLDLTGYGNQELETALSKKDEEEPEVEFTQELMESHNYLVLYFDNEMDWLNLQSLYPLKTVKASDDRKGFRRQGVGRVVRGVDFINRLRNEDK